MPDARVQSAIHHWAPRFVANGVPADRFPGGHRRPRALGRLVRGVVRARRRARALGREALAAGYRLSAGEHLTRAAVCYHFAKFVFVTDYEQMRRAHAKAVECRNLALPLLDPPGERVAIPYEGSRLYGNLRRPRTARARPPVVVMCMGLDSAKEEMDAYEQSFLARGMATLAFDGPGQGEGEYEFPIRGDYEAPVKAVDRLGRAPRPTSTPRASGCGAFRSAATTRRAPRPSSGASRRASRSPALTIWAESGSGCRS